MIVDGDLTHTQRKGYILIGLAVGEPHCHDLPSEGWFQPPDEVSQTAGQTVIGHLVKTFLIVEQQLRYALPHAFVGNDIAATVAYSLHQIARLAPGKEHYGMSKQL